MHIICEMIKGRLLKKRIKNNANLGALSKWKLQFPFSEMSRTMERETQGG